MTGAEVALPIAMKGIQAASGAAGGKSGGSGSGNQASPEQAALAQYHYGENLLGARSAYAATGTGESTMATQASEGARNQFAKEMATAADKNAALTATANQSLQQLAGQNAEQQGFGAATGGAQTGGTV